MTATDARQAWLALEHEAVWFYPVVGARFRDLEPRAREAYDDHRAARDALLTVLARADVEPRGTALTYDLTGVDDAAAARTRAQDLEGRIAAACLTLVGLTTGEARTDAVDALRDATEAGRRWGARPLAFPGLDAPADVSG